VVVAELHHRQEAAAVGHEGGRVQERRVIGLHAAIDRMLPVDPRRGAVIRDQLKGRDVEVFQHALHVAQEGIEIELPLRIGMDDDDAISSAVGSAIRPRSCPGSNDCRLGTLISSPSLL
jgi:hypothetical protein